MPPKGKKRKAAPQSSRKPAAKKQKQSATVSKPVENTKTKGSSDGGLVSLLTDPGWKSVLKDEFEKDYFKEIEKKLKEHEKKKDQIFPPRDLIFNAFNSTPMDKVKVVILGQDPYHDDGQAMGLSFSVPQGLAVPPSLKNIYKELTNDKKVKNFSTPDHGCLEKWCEDGVLLLNATLTVTAHQPNSHSKYGWQKFTDAVIKTMSDECTGLVFILWGGLAHKKEKLVDQTKHKIVKTAHPSPLSFNKFLNCGCFSVANDALKKLGKEPIDWSLC